VTKAALYYHFKSKEAIVRSFTEDYVHELDALIAWGSDQPLDASGRAVLLARYSDIVEHRLGVLRFLEQNQAAVHHLMTDYEGQDRKRMFRKQFETFRDLRYPFYLAVVLLEHAELLAAGPLPGEAEPLLAEAQDIFERLDARPWVERAARLPG